MSPGTKNGLHSRTFKPHIIFQDRVKVLHCIVLPSTTYKTVPSKTYENYFSFFFPAPYETPIVTIELFFKSRHTPKMDGVFFFNYLNIFSLNFLDFLTIKADLGHEH